MTLDWFTWLDKILEHIASGVFDGNWTSDKSPNYYRVYNRPMMLTKVWVSLPLPDP